MGEEGGRWRGVPDIVTLSNAVQGGGSLARQGGAVGDHQAMSIDEGMAAASQIGRKALARMRLRHCILHAASLYVVYSMRLRRPGMELCIYGMPVGECCAYSVGCGRKLCIGWGRVLSYGGVLSGLPRAWEMQDALDVLTLYAICPGL